MSSIRLEDGRLVIDYDEQEVVSLPKTITPQFLDAVFDAQPGEDGHIASLHRALMPEDRRRFAQACEDLGSPYDSLWAQAAISWAVVDNDDGQWDLTSMTIAYERHVGSWLVEDAFVTATGIWFVTNFKHQTLTTHEFEYLYGCTIEQHLGRYVEERTKVVDNLIQVMSSPMCDRMVSMMMPDGRIAVTKMTGPSGIASKFWSLPRGQTYVMEEPCPES